MDTNEIITTENDEGALDEGAQEQHQQNQQQSEP